jgi:hypothetical protein
MSPRTHVQVTVVTGALRAEAGEWDRQATVMAGLARKVAAMELGRAEAGLFQLVVAPYNEVVAHVAARCGEGRDEMTEVATALRTVADRYDEEDRDAARRSADIP